MKVRVIALFAAVLLTVVSTSAQAKVHHHRHYAKHHVHHERAVRLDFTITCKPDNDGRYNCLGAIDKPVRSATPRNYAVRTSTPPSEWGSEERVVEHPAGCPRTAFCGCGVSTKVFGHPVRELYLASNYGYYFNEGVFVAGNVAYRAHHAVYIMGGTQSAALIYDPNSGGHQTRVHYRDLSNYRVVDPHSPKRRLAGA